ncbi:MAG: hypothetical protein ACFB13_08845 [Kiloniellaceae bacterium]
MSKLSSLLLAGALVLPLPAYADCAQRIEAVETHPALAGNADETTPEAQSSQSAAAGNEEKVVKEEMVEKGASIQENGGETVYQEGGPAAPRESWFTDSKDKATVLTHLDSAREAKAAGDEKVCLEEIEQAEKIMEADAG